MLSLTTIHTETGDTQLEMRWRWSSNPCLTYPDKHPTVRRQERLKRSVPVLELLLTQLSFVVVFSEGPWIGRANNFRMGDDKRQKARYQGTGTPANAVMNPRWVSS